MGRPIKKRYFVKQGTSDTSVAVKYKGVTVAINNNGTGYSTGATASISAPNEGSDGVQATVTLSITAAGGITAATIVNPGAGYNANPTVTLVPAANQSNNAIATTGSFTLTNVSGVQGIYPGMLVSAAYGGLAGWSHVASVGTNTITLDKALANGSSGTNVVFTYQDTGTNATFTTGLTQQEDDTGTLACTAYISTVTNATTAAILKQHGSRSFLVENTLGRGFCKLTTSTAAAASLAPGQMNIIAKDANGSTYVVTKITSRKARVIRQTVNGSFVFASGTEVRWAAGWANAVGTVSTQAGACVGIQTY